MYAKESSEQSDVIIEPQRVLHAESVFANHGRPEIIFAFSAVGISGFLMGLFVGWMVWG